MNNFKNELEDLVRKWLQRGDHPQSMLSAIEEVCESMVRHFPAPPMDQGE